MDIGHRMKELRIQYGLTQQELADRAELTKGFISQLERNQNSPSIGTLLDIIQCLGTTPAEFFTDEEPEQIVFKEEDYFEKTDRFKKVCHSPISYGGSSSKAFTHSSFGLVLVSTVITIYFPDGQVALALKLPSLAYLI